MASLGHLAVGAALGRFHRRRGRPRAAWPALLGFAALALAPDLDVLAFHFHIPYGAEWGHRGAAHSMLLGLALGLAVGVATRSRQVALFASLATVSHGLLDALTDGGLGVALLWPWHLTRYFAPWRPIPVAPIGARFLSARGLYCAGVELALFAPFWLYALWPRKSAGPPARS